MNIHILTLFPKMFETILNESIVLRAQKKGLVKIVIHNLRDWADDKHGTVDDKAFGGGAGMILKVDVIDKALKDIKNKIDRSNPLEKIRESHANNSKIILTDPRGKKFTQTKAKQLSKIDNIIIICGHYGGIDERVLDLVDETISIGNFVLTGGEIPAMAMTDTVVRLIPGVINADSLLSETHSHKNYNQFAQYTRPEIYKPISKKIKKTLDVPKVLLSGNHKLIEEWRRNF